MVTGKRSFALGLIIATALLLLGAGYSAGFAQLENVRVGEVRAGETFTVSFQVHNTLNDRLRYVVVKAPAGTNFSPVGGDTWSSGGEVERNSAVSGSLTFRADDNVIAGVYSIPFTITSESKTLSGASFSGNVVNSLQTLSTTESVNVRVVGAPELFLTLKSSQPAFIEAGKEALLNFEISNGGNDYARDVAVSIGSPENADLGSASREIYLGDIAPSGKGTFSASIIPENGPDIRSVSMPISAKYYGGEREWLETVPLEMTAEIEARLSEGIVAFAGKNEERLDFVVRNTGSDSAKNIRVSLITEFPITPSGRSAAIDVLSPGEEKTVSFTVDVDSKAAERDYPIQLGVSFEENRERKSSVLETEFPVKKAQSNAPYFIGLAGAGVLAILVFRKLKGNKKDEKR